MPAKRKTNAQKALTGERRACRTVVNLQGHPLAAEVYPPPHFTARQIALWEQFYDVLDAHDILCGLDTPGLALLVLAYEKALYSPDVSVSEIKGTLLLLSKYGLTPDARAHINPIPRQKASPLAELRSRRAKAI